VVVVGTPIGNLDDLSPRARAALATADVICCEDTRHTRKLLTHAGISGISLLALHEHNEVEMAPRVVARAAAGATVALVSDAGMPGISDPGERVVAAAQAAGVTVTVIPGPSAPIAALVGSGLATGRFCFEGFLPRKGRERGERLAQIAVEERTVVLFEAPHRVARTLDDLCLVCGPQRPVAVARELTKRHEQRWSGTLEAALRWVEQNPPKGEWVLVLAGAPQLVVETDDDTLRAQLARRLALDGDRRAAVVEVAAAAGVPKRRVYQLALELRRPGRDGVDSGEV
jgi:16S rRNA (cytidine1402-2'-O)-methyltransferase